MTKNSFYNKHTLEEANEVARKVSLFKPTVAIYVIDTRHSIQNHHGYVVCEACLLAQEDWLGMAIITTYMNGVGT